MPAKSITIIVALLMLTGCAAKRMPFNENEFAGIKMDGDKTVTGQLFLIDQLEEKQVGDKAEVTLEPVTAYSNEWYEVSYLGNRSLAKPDSRYNKYIRRTQTDEEGNFTIANIAPGDYYLTGAVYWQAATCSGNVVEKKVPVSIKLTITDSDPAIVEAPLTKEFISPTEICGLYNQNEWEKVDF